MDRKLDVRKIYESVKEKITFKPEAALVLGSGLGNFAEKVEIAEILDYKDIPGFPVSTVPGHKGPFYLRLCGGRTHGDHAGPSTFLRGVFHG